MGLIMILFVVDMVKGDALAAKIETGLFPERAADFIADSGANGRVFSSDVWGGYLLWRLPQSTILSDGRALSEEVDLNNYEITKASANWDQKLLNLETKIIVFSAFNPFTGKENKLWQALNFHPGWQLVYADDVALVYFRQDVGPEVQRMSQEEKRSKSVDQALVQKQKFIKKEPKIPWHWGDLGHIQLVRGDIPAAVQAYRRALDLDPANEDYRGRVRILETREKKDGRSS